MSDTGFHIALIDDHQLFRLGLKTMLQSEQFIHSIQDFGEASAFFDSCKKRIPEVALMDVDMPEMGGLDALTHCQKYWPQIRVIMLSMHGNYSTVKASQDAGAKGYLLKTADKEEVIQAIQTVLRGEVYLTPKAEEVMSGPISHPNYIDEVVLTPREKEVLTLVCQGLSTKEIADKLFVSENTAETHRRNLLSKTSCRNTAELVGFAIRHHLD